MSQQVLMIRLRDIERAEKEISRAMTVACSGAYFQMQRALEFMQLARQETEADEKNRNRVQAQDYEAEPPLEETK